MAKFIIIEQDKGGKQPPKSFARFEWDAQHKNIPLQPWSFGVTQRMVRTDYPGADDPTIQVLGPNYTPFTLNGRWDNRHNPETPNYATVEREKFEDMVRRGNEIRIIFGKITIQGVISGCNFDYRRDWDIGYSFTVEPLHRQPGGFFALQRSPRTTLNATQLRNETSDEVEDIQERHLRAPRFRITGSTYVDADEKIAELADGVATIDDAIDQRTLSLEVEANTSLRRLAQAFLNMSTLGNDLITLLKDNDTSEAMDVELPIAVLDYDVWSREIMYLARRVVVVAQRAASELQQRVDPNALALYRPQVGEHLYETSNRFYKTPHNWRVIFERNGLVSTTLTGEELLVIPESTGR